MEAAEMIHAIQDGSVRLSSLLSTARRWGGQDVMVRSCCSDARQVQPGDVYIALLQADGDGHDEIGEAVERGAIAAVVERPLPIAIPQYVVADTREAYGLLCQHIAGHPTQQLRTIEVTGSHGKTSVARLISSILNAAGRRAGSSHSRGWSDSVQFYPGDMSTPSAPELAWRLGEMAVQGCEDAVLEVSSRALAERRTAGVSWDVAVLTNIRSEHLDWHGTVTNYRRAKMRMLEQLKSSGVAVINLDDPATRQIRPELSSNVVTIGMGPEADVSAMVIERHKSEQIFLLNVRSHSAAVRTRMIGEHHVYNCLAAAAVTLALGVDLDRVVHGLEAVESLPGRLERIECGQSFGVYIDGAESPDRLIHALRALRPVTQGKIICVYGPDGANPTDHRPLMGRAVERHAEIGVITSNNPGIEPVLRIAHDVLDGYQRVARGHIMPDRRRAIGWALRQARPEDTVLIAGKGDLTGQDLGDRIVPFDDREITRDQLYHLDDPKWFLADQETGDEPEPVILPFR